MALLPGRVAREMKADVLKPPERIFQKIYIQRHDNGRDAGAMATAGQWGWGGGGEREGEGLLFRSRCHL